MKLGVMGAIFAGRSLAEAVEACGEFELDAIELPVGAYPGAPFFEVRKVLARKGGAQEIAAVCRESAIEISALAVHGNPVHPDAAIARAHHAAFVDAVKLAGALEVDTVVTFSGCPGGSPRDRTPNWVTCPWPGDFLEILRYQWDDVLVPYWGEQLKLAHEHGVRIAIEAHPGFCVYNPETLIRLSERAQKASGIKGRPILGANLDPSHFFWQGIDPVVAARHLGEAGLLFYCHAKDTELVRDEAAVNGYNDARPYTDLRRRSWNFRTCGYGHDASFWKPFFSMLRRYGYDGTISIEHEDALMSAEEGLARAVDFLRESMIADPADTPWWT
ncbi:MAG TPA: sugar phosphate isomerase/epimerase [Phycisphaerales bacterium]|nr:sugar phosphate isomerase/epimerase [Phycisphaerales bacterium]HMP36473.1 sugar phosphate isomerase/epimerase [Phycisphaerales bacterium]